VVDLMRLLQTMKHGLPKCDAQSRQTHNDPKVERRPIYRHLSPIHRAHNDSVRTLLAMNGISRENNGAVRNLVIGSQ
jgi:hypothetical protein